MMFKDFPERQARTIKDGVWYDADPISEPPPAPPAPPPAPTGRADPAIFREMLTEMKKQTNQTGRQLAQIAAQSIKQSGLLENQGILLFEMREEMRQQKVLQQEMQTTLVDANSDMREQLSRLNERFKTVMEELDIEAPEDRV